MRRHAFAALGGLLMAVLPAAAAAAQETVAEAASEVGPAPAAGPAGEAPPGPGTMTRDWSGLYLGGRAGYDRQRADSALLGASSTRSRYSTDESFGGLQIGYDHWMPPRLLLGVEADVSFPDFIQNDDNAATLRAPQGTLADRIDYIGTLRGRIGFTLNRWALYGTGGFAWSQSRVTAGSDLLDGREAVLHTHAGWALGVGAELAVARALTARLEYLYEDFGRIRAALPAGPRYESAFDSQALYAILAVQLRRPDGDAPAGGAGEWWLLAPEKWQIHGQLTLIEQGYPGFHSPYQGANSLAGNAQAKDTGSATAFIGFRPTDGTEIYLDPELMQGFGLSNTYGVAGFPNGEAQKSNFPVPRFNVARILVRHTLGLGGEQETIEDGPNQFAGTQDISRLTFTIGKLEVEDYFDGNAYAHDPRQDFLNWNLMCCGAYDWTMDKIGYTWGALAELNQKRWALRAGYFLVDVVSNDDHFDTHVPERGEYIVELERRYSVLSRAGKLRSFAWVNIANAGSYSQALALPLTSPSYPDIALTRRVRANYGFVLNAEQTLAGDLGLFSRAAWDRGLTEKMGWTDCDESLSLGVSLKGASWRHPNDTVGLGGVVEGLSPEARAYFAAGGLGIVIGDGRLNYRQEKILEAYYAHFVSQAVTVTFDYQFVDNPAYNADRGPVSIFALRLHTEI